MPEYPFECPCGEYKEVFRHMVDAGDPEICVCGKDMLRIYSGTQAIVKNYGYFNNGLGCWIKGKDDVKDAMTKYNHTTGGRMVELGTEKANVKPKEPDYSLSRDEMQVAERILDS